MSVLRPNTGQELSRQGNSILGRGGRQRSRNMTTLEDYNLFRGRGCKGEMRKGEAGEVGLVQLLMGLFSLLKIQALSRGTLNFKPKTEKVRIVPQKDHYNCSVETGLERGEIRGFYSHPRGRE